MCPFPLPLGKTPDSEPLSGNKNGSCVCSLARHFPIWLAAHMQIINSNGFNNAQSRGCSADKDRDTYVHWGKVRVLHPC